MTSSSRIVITGIGSVRWESDDSEAVLPWIVSRKSRKYMGKQDEMSVIAAGKALKSAALHKAPECEHAGIYLTVGHIPFEREDIDVIANHSVDANAQFCMKQFATEGIEQVNPLLTFRCLPNMPAFHVSLNFGIRGPSMVSYPGIAQCYAVLQQACRDLHAGTIRHALIGAVADQGNFLVNFFFDRSADRRELARMDSAACVCIETEETAAARGAHVLARLINLSIEYKPQQAIVPTSPSCTELLFGLMQALALGATVYTHESTSLDFCQVVSRWEF